MGPQPRHCHTINSRCLTRGERKRKFCTTMGQKCFLQSIFVLGTLSSLKYFCCHCFCLLPVLFRFLLCVHVRLPHTYWAHPAFENLQPNIVYSQRNTLVKDGRVCPHAPKCLERSEGQLPGELWFLPPGRCAMDSTSTHCFFQRTLPHPITHR